jgi:uncharacterized membrane protein
VVAGLREVADEHFGAGLQTHLNGYRAAEARTSGEIVCVLAQSSRRDGTAGSCRGPGGLALPWLLVAFTAMTVQRILSLQIVLFFALMVTSLAAGTNRTYAA